MALQLEGIVPPLVTPLSGRDELDHAGLERLVEHVLAGGVQALFILGSTGEAPSLSYRLRREMIEQTCRLVKQRVPVLVGITDTAFVESLHVAMQAADAGATAVVLSTPYYFPAGQTELLDYVRNIAAELPLPLFLYNMPSLTKVWFEIETLKQLTDIPSIVGLKDSSGDLAYYEQAVKLKEIRSDWSVLIGPEAMLLQSLMLGGNGGVAGGANVFPHWFVQCHAAYRSGDLPKAEAYHQQILQFQQIYDVGKYASRHIKATKCALSLLNICNDYLAEPFHHFKAPERHRVERILDELKSSVQ